MVIYPICSSSKGNCTCVLNSSGTVLIDAGIGARTIFNMLKLVNVSSSSIKAIFITHEHVDHVSGLFNLTKILKVPVFASKKTLKALVLKNNIFIGEQTRLFEINLKKFRVCGLEIGAFHVFHDCADCLGYTVGDGNKSFSICTDVGVVTPSIIGNLEKSDFVFVESNYDPNLLEMCKYPSSVKARIKSKLGHLSNFEAAKLIESLIVKGVKKFIIGHISQNSNLPQLAMQTIISYLLTKNLRYGKDYKLYFAPVKNNGTFYEI